MFMQTPYLTRVSTAIQFTSQVLPPSSEKACSKRHESAEMSDQTFRTKIVLPLNDGYAQAAAVGIDRAKQAPPASKR
jgi:hypothetical protein